MNLNARKWLLSCSYNPNSSSIAGHLEHISKGLDYYSSKYDNFLLLGDYNAQIDNDHVKDFCSTYSLKSLIRQNTCFKSLVNPSGIDLILTNCPRYFQHSGVYETGLSHFHKLTFTVLKTSFQKLKPKIIKYRDYKHFNEVNFLNQLNISLESRSFSTYQDFEKRFLHVFNSFAPVKRKTVRANHAPFMIKKLSKAIMKRTQLQNRYF